MTFGNGSFIRCWPADQDPGEAKSADDWNSRAQQSPGHSRSIVSMDVLLFRSNMLVELIRYIVMYALRETLGPLGRLQFSPDLTSSIRRVVCEHFGALVLMPLQGTAAAGCCCRVPLQGLQGAAVKVLCALYGLGLEKAFGCCSRTFFGYLWSELE